jgi:hypothetical protein
VIKSRPFVVIPKSPDYLGYVTAEDLTISSTSEEEPFLLGFMALDSNCRQLVDKGITIAHFSNVCANLVRKTFFLTGTVTCRLGYTHLECINYACVPVSGFGPDKCRTDVDCSLTAYACLQSDPFGNPISCIEESGRVKTYATKSECEAIGSGCLNVGQSCVPLGQCPLSPPIPPPVKNTACLDLYANRCLTDSSGSTILYTSDECANSVCTGPQYVCIDSNQCP